MLLPANSADGAIARQWEVLKIIPSARSPGLSPTEFKQELCDRGYDVSLRTVQRDLKALSQVFDIDREPGDKNETLWRWQSGAKLDIQSLELTDALTLRLIETSLRPLLPATVLKALEPRLRNAAEKLDAIHMRNAVSDWANKVASVLPMVPFIPPAIDPAVLETVQSCLLKDFVMTCLYRSVGSEKPKEIKLHPLGLVQRGPVTYLVATAFNYDDPRPFALHRMSAVENAYEAVKRPKGFSLKQFIDDGGMAFGEATPINLVAKISPMLARELEESRLSTHQKIRRVGEWFRIEAAVQDTWQLRWWLLGKAGDLTVLAPTELKELIRDRINRAAQCYME